MNYDGSGRKVTWSKRCSIPEVSWTDQWKQRETQVKAVGMAARIRIACSVDSNQTKSNSEIRQARDICIKTVYVVHARFKERGFL
jgi:hypothetical protein